ncbi:helicase-related protein [Streptomyces sp. NK08204]|uniref:helicase-related protein n=1 Tax=Streptomyces sp. NK08204 TaxID=2873260 RepID=UPI001CECDA23|nr:helicase-related protein [Streptomyces sp. NK08204]
MIQVQPGSFWEFLLEGEAGDFRRVSLSEDELPEIEVIDSTSERSFDADAQSFRLGVEARRIRTRFQHDMGALAVSSIEPLPHQLEAVYGKFLQEPRLRFLLADDPGAGKTIMTGLYIKELQLRGAADRVLIVAPANLGFQWQRELDERFRIAARRITRETIDADPMVNPWEADGVFIVSRDLLKTESVLESFAAAQRSWDLAVLDEAHGYTLKINKRGAIDRRTDRYKAAERVARQADRLLLLTATPHSGREESLWGLMRLLDGDAYGDRCPERVEIMPHHYSRTTKEQMVDLRGRALFRPRTAHTITYALEGSEWELYKRVSRFITQGLTEIRRERADSGRASVSGFALTTMQRRLASSVRAITRTLRRRVERLERELDQPSGHYAGIGAPEFDRDANGDRPENERWALEEQALDQVALFRTPEEVEAELELLRPLLAQAEETELQGGEVKLGELWKILDTYGVGDDASKKLLIFTEHKDTLDFLVDELSSRFDVTAIHGGLRPADRVQAERDFREHAQIMVATEAAGEGINLQFCHLMVNYDIPWNPNRLEQRMGRVHRIGQTEDVHIFNLVAANTKEGHVLGTVLGKIETMRKNEALGDQVFDVIGEILAGYRLPELLESVISDERTPEEALNEFGAQEGEFDERLIERMRELSEKALATGHIDWRLHRRATTRAEERRLPPEHLKRFFLDAVDHLQGRAEERLDRASIRVSRTPDILIARDRDRGTMRQLQPAYERITFDKTVAVQRLAQDSELGAPRPELCGPGHPLFEALLDHVIEQTGENLSRGAVFHDPALSAPALLHILQGEVVDGHRTTVHRSMASIIESEGEFRPVGGALYDLLAGRLPDHEMGLRPSPLPEQKLITWARRNVYEDRLMEVRDRRKRTADIQEEFLHTSFRALLARYDGELYDLEEEMEQGITGAEGRYRRVELLRRTAVERRDRRIADTARTRQVDRGPVTVIAQALLLPSPAEHIPHQTSRGGTGASNGLSDREIERIAVKISMDHEYAHGSEELRSVEVEHLGFDLISERRDGTRYIEVKGRSGVGSVELTWSEYIAAGKFGPAYWLYVVLDCASEQPRLYRIQDPVTTLAGSFKPTQEVRYGIAPGPIIDAAQAAEGDSP